MRRIFRRTLSLLVGVAIIGFFVWYFAVSGLAGQPANGKPAGCWDSAAQAYDCP